jgi:hypothetical protein
MYKKWLFLTISLIVSLSLVACGNETENQEVENEPTEEVEQQEEVKKPINYKIEIGEQLTFEKFDVEIRRVKVKEKKDELHADIILAWVNRDYDYGYPEKTLYTTTTLEVKQGEAVLNEINDAWNVENKDRSSVFVPNKLNQVWVVELTYKLKDNETPIDLYFTPLTETEETQKFTINLTNE